MNTKPSSARLIALGILGCLLLSYPLLSIFNVPRLVFGVPALYAYLFGVWILFVAALALIVE
jgi:hypothetical protein